jgi:RNA recognition motif-containing protein
LFFRHRDPIGSRIGPEAQSAREKLHPLHFGIHLEKVAGKDGSMNIYVGNLAFQVKEPTLEKLFGEFGLVENVKIITDRRSGVSKGYGFVEMPDNSEADQAIKALNGIAIEGRNMKVNPADPGGKKKKNKRRRRRSW